MFIKINEDVKFKCNACGKCCSHIKGMVSNEDKEFLEENVFGKLPVIQLCPVDKMTFPLWDFEARRFREWEKKANLSANILPFRIIYDLKTSTTIVLSYFMDSRTDACPFLENNKCLIHEEKRAYVCRMFPLNRSPFFERQNIFGPCGSVENISKNMPSSFKDTIKFLKHAFSASLEDVVQNEIIVEWSNKIIVDMIKKGIIKPAINYPYDFLLKRVENSRMVDFSDFLFESGYMEKQEVENLIKDFDNNKQAIVQINEAIL